MIRASFMSCVMFGAILQGQRPIYWNNGTKVPIFNIGALTPYSVVVDSPEVRQLVSEEEKRQEEADRFYQGNHTEDERRRHVLDLIKTPDQMLPGHKEFLEAMAKGPAVTVPRKTRGRVLEISRARCLPDGVSTVTFVRMVIVGKKPPAGTEVWVCENPAAFGAP